MVPPTMELLQSPCEVRHGDKQRSGGAALPCGLRLHYARRYAADRHHHLPSPVEALECIALRGKAPSRGRKSFAQRWDGGKDADLFFVGED